MNACPLIWKSVELTKSRNLHTNAYISREQVLPRSLMYANTVKLSEIMTFAVIDAREILLEITKKSTTFSSKNLCGILSPKLSRTHSGFILLKQFTQPFETPVMIF